MSTKTAAAAARPEITNKPAPEKSRRDELRTAILSGAKRNRITITFRGVELEMVQPSIGEALSGDDDISTIDRIIDIMTNYCYVPGTNEKVFEEADADTIRGLPMDNEIREFVNNFNKLLEVDVEGN